MRFDRSGAIVPDLALAVPSKANGGISAHGRVLTYRLRREVRWQDGVPFTARDVAFTWRALVDPRNLVPAHGDYDRIAAVTAPDPWSVRVVLKEPFAPALALFAGGKQGAIVPAHLLEGERDLARSSFESHPVGTGPYRVTAWRRGESIEFERSPYARVRPPFERVRLAFFSNEQALSAAAQAGEVDVALGFSAQSLRPLAGDSRLRAVSTPTYQFEHLTFNLRPGSGPQTGVAVRRAFVRAIDVPRYARAIFFARSGLAPLDQAPWSWARARDVAYYPHDPEGARRALLQAGYTLPVPLTIVSTTGNDSRTRLEVRHETDLARAGIALSIKNVPANLLLARQADGSIPPREGASRSRCSLSLRPHRYLNDERYVSSRSIPPEGVNMAGYRSAEVDRLARAAVSVYARPERAAMYAIQHVLVRHLPSIRSPGCRRSS